MARSNGIAKKALVVNSVSSVISIGLQITFLVWVNRYLLQRIEPAEYAIFPLIMSLVVFADLFKIRWNAMRGRYR